MKIRRYDIDYIFETVENCQLHALHNNNDRFVCIPRFNVCVNLRIKSIKFLFTHVYKVRTAKTYAVWMLLYLIAYVPSLHKLLNIVGLKHSIRKVNPTGNTNWSEIDVLYVEWHFFGVFMKSDDVVIHILAKESYVQRFNNEINARKLVKSETKGLTKLFPNLMKVSEQPKYYVEELSVDAGKQLVSFEMYKKAQKKIKKVNKQTLKTVSFKNYYKQLIDQVGVLNDSSLKSTYNNLLQYIEANYLHLDLMVDLALVHGDFNSGQVLMKNDKIKIIDWGDGGLLNRYFDFITITIRKSPNYLFDMGYFPKENKSLKKYFKGLFKSEVHQKLYVLLSLLEVFAISKGEFELREGNYIQWKDSVESNLKL